MRNGWFAIGLSTALCAAPAMADAADIETVVVIGNAPLPGIGVDADKIPGEVQSLSVSELTHSRQSDVLINAVASQLASVSLNNEQGSQFQPDLVYRGFEASPISGIAQGVAVYQDGVRLNESFGDTVNWDLVPEFAVERFTLQSNNPAFGLNTLGGAVSLGMKSGLSFQGLDAQLSGGSFGNISGNAEYGARSGAFGVYLGIGGVRDDGYRYHSPTTLRQGYGDLAYERGGLEVHLSASAALNDIAAVGPTPVEMLTQDPKAIFTYPQSIRNEMELVQLRSTYRQTEQMQFSVSGYYRHYLQHLVDGNTTDVAYCENDPSQLCLEGNNRYPDDALYDSEGHVVPASVLPPGATPGETDFTRTDTDGFGAAAQISISAPLFGHGNNLVFGVSVDNGTTDYSAFGELGALMDNLGVAGSGVIIDQGRSRTASMPIEQPVHVRGGNTYTGVYAVEVFDVTPRLSWTVNARINLADISLRDLTGGTLTGNHGYTHLNPGTGATYKITDRLTAYIGVSESNRAPTAGELSCADRQSPCLLDAFLVSDPALKQVVSRNIEAGLRGTFSAARLSGVFAWSASLYRTDASNDIFLLATEINGFGFFQNAGTTRHQGLDLRVGYREPRWSFNASYSYLDATFRDSQTLSSDSPAANGDGEIFVVRGDRLPLNPAQRLTLSGEFNATRDLTLGANLRAQSGQYLAGDQSNQEPKLPAYATLDLHASYAVGSHLKLFGEIQNLFDNRYYTYGAFTDLGGLPPNFSLSNPRTYSPAPGRLIFVGVNAQL